MSRLRRIVTVGVAVGALALLAPAGVGGPAVGGADECPPIALAFVGALSGSNASSGEPLLLSTRIALAEHNADKKRCPVGLVVLDTRGDPAVALARIAEVTEDPQVIGIVGPVYSGETLAVLPVLAKADLPMVTPSATNPDLSKKPRNVFHRIVGTDALLAGAVANWMTGEYAVKRVAVIDDGTLYGKKVADLVNSQLTKDGVTVAERSAIDPASTDHSVTVRKIAGANVDAVFFGGLSDSGVPFERQLSDAGIDVPFAGGDGMLDGKFLASVGSGSQNPKIAIGCACVVVAVSPPQERFSSRYVDRYGVLPTYFSFEAYDATRLLLEGIDDGATTRAELDDWLDDVQYQGVSQQIAFDRRGEAKAPVFTIFGISGDQYRPVGRVVGGKVERITPAK